jgi:hypothetical protein
MARQNKKWTDEAVEAEITRLNGSEFVRLARRENQIRNRRRQYMWSLQYMEARGRQLASNGITYENMEEKLFGDLPIEED